MHIPHRPCPFNRPRPELLVIQESLRSEDEYEDEDEDDCSFSEFTFRILAP